MATIDRAAAGGATHEVLNQAVPLEDYNVFTSDRVLREAVSREGGDFAVDKIAAVGAAAGSARAIEAGFLADKNKPELKLFDRFGNRIDEVDFHPAWHELLGMQVSHGTHALPWREPEPGAHVARAAAFMCMSETDAGPGCPISMTYSVIPALRKQPELAAVWEPRFTSLDYDPRMVPAEEKTGALCGMAMTEKQGGSDVRANTTARDPPERRRPRGRVRDHRPQVVLLGADVRRLPRPRPDRERRLLLLDAALHARRRAQPLPHPAAQGQARQPLQRLQRGRVPRRLGADGRR